jgi:hypothetical protein
MNRLIRVLGADCGRVMRSIWMDTPCLGPECALSHRQASTVDKRTVPFVGQALQTRSYKFYSSHLTEIVQGSWSDIDEFSLSGRALEAYDYLSGAAAQGRVREVRRRQSYYIKPTEKRKQYIWTGVVRRKRRDFNNRLRWALKSMSRHAFISFLV